MAKEIFVAYGIDVDAVAGWLGSYGGQDSPCDITRGLFAGEVGSLRLLRLFEKWGIKTTWFIPGHSIETFPEQMKAVADAGHEIGMHGYSHENPVATTPEQEEAIFDKCIEVITKLAGKPPRGYVAPWWELGPNTAELLLKKGIKYDHSMMNNDFHPFYVRVGDSWTKIDYSKHPSAWMKPLMRGKETDLDRHPSLLVSRRPAADDVHEGRAEQPRLRQPAASRRDVAGPVRLGLPRIRLRGLHPHDPPGRVGQGAEAPDAGEAPRAYEGAQWREVRHLRGDRRRFQGALSAEQAGAAGIVMGARVRRVKRAVRSTARVRQDRRAMTDVRVEVLPVGIGCLDQVDLPLSAPLLQLLLARNSVPHVDVTLRVDQTPNAIAIRVLAASPGSVLVDATAEIVCHANVERAARPAGEDVDPVKSLHGPNHIVVPGAAQHEVVRCRPGTSSVMSAVALTNEAPCLRRTASRCGAHGATMVPSHHPGPKVVQLVKGDPCAS